MRQLRRALRRLLRSKAGSVPLQYAMVLGATAAVTMLIVQTASTKIADKFTAVTTALNKIQF